MCVNILCFTNFCTRVFDVIWSSYFYYITTITTTTTMTITCMVSLLLLLLFLYNCRVNPVTGRYEPPRPSPLEGMTDEQKEHEAMKLVNVLDKLTRYVRTSSCACVRACVLVCLCVCVRAFPVVTISRETFFCLFRVVSPFYLVSHSKKSNTPSNKLSLSPAGTI